MYGQPPQSDSSQPEWRLSPRPARNDAPLPPPPQPPRPTSSVYTPATYGPISGSNTVSPITPHSGSGNDPRTWGVRYNQHQHIHPIHAPPPLPPRPSSTNEQPYAYTYSQPFSPPPPPPPPPPPAPTSAPVVDTHSAPTTHGYESFGDAQSPSTTSTIPPPYVPSHGAPAPIVPAPPPKIPQGYQYAPVHPPNPIGQPPLLAQGAGPAATQGSYEFRPQRMMSIAPQTSSSALGPGTPSDWEHLGPTPGDFDDSAWFPPRQPEPIPQEVIQTPPGFSSGIPTPGPTPAPTTGRENHAANPLPHVDTNYHYQHRYQQAAPPAEYQFDQTRRHDSVSPISPMTMLGAQNPPPPPARMGSTSSGTSMRSHADSIDNVIDAWVKPLAPTPRTSSSNQADAPSRLDPPTDTSQEASENNLKTPVEVPPPPQNIQPPVQDQIASPGTTAPAEPQAALPAIKAVDPYEDLDPWFKSSLTRYVATLRKEAVADSDEERYKIFTAFMAKEAKLREILYNIEPEPQQPEPSPRVSAPSRRLSSLSEDRTSTYESGLIPVETEDTVPPTPSTVTDEGNDMDDVVSEYSAGGRPISAKRARRGSQWTPKLSSLGPEENPTTRLSKSSLAQLSEENAQAHDLAPLTINPPRPIYTPFRYTEGPQRGSDKLSFGRPAYQAYSDLRASAVNGRIMSNAPPPTSRSRSATLTSPAQNENDETFLGIIRHKSSAYLETAANRKSMPAALLPEALRQEQGKPNVVEELRAMVWTPLDKQSESSWHVTIREGLEKLPDDFSYIQQTIDEWENAAKTRKQTLDQERTVRQEESEEQIDKLFNEKEIGYADINTLEEDFRQTEARVQLDEERQDVENFVSQVFNPLDERLKEEISALRKSYDSALQQLERDQKGKNSPVEQCSPSVTMKMVNETHSKLELRFQKRLEIALDCERRRKKAERRPLVFMGDMASLRKLDGDFDRMEKRNILEAAKDRDDRANRLMDSFDDAILHGLGMNQSLLDELVSKVAHLEFTTLRASGVPDSELEQILKATATFATSLRADSEAILRCSGIADMALNDADYNVSVAEARYANSDTETFGRLEDEKKKEDAILETDLNSKLQSIKKSPADIEANVQRLLQTLADAPPAALSPKFAPASQPIDVTPLELRPGTAAPSRTPASLAPPALSPKSVPASQPNDVPPPLELRPGAAASSRTPAPPSAPPVASPPAQVDRASGAESEHQERLRRALEQAKKRNAARNP